MKLIDTNIFLEILLKQKKSKIAKNVLTQLVETKEPFIISAFTIHSIIVILENRKLLKELQIFINSLYNFENIIFYYPDFEEEKDIINGMPNLPLDFDDAYQYYIANKMNAQIVTFDRDFKKLKDCDVQIL